MAGFAEAVLCGRCDCLFYALRARFRAEGRVDLLLQPAPRRTAQRRETPFRAGVGSLRRGEVVGDLQGFHGVQGRPAAVGVGLFDCRKAGGRSGFPDGRIPPFRNGGGRACVTTLSRGDGPVRREKTSPKP